MLLYTQMLEVSDNGGRQFSYDKQIPLNTNMIQTNHVETSERTNLNGSGSNRMGSIKKQIRQ